MFYIFFTEKEIDYLKEKNVYTENVKFSRITINANSFLTEYSLSFYVEYLISTNEYEKVELKMVDGKLKLGVW